MSVLWWKKNNSVEIKGYQQLIENSVYIKECQDFQKKPVTTITRYALPHERDIINYLQTKSSEMNQLRSNFSAFNALSYNNPLELILLADAQLSKKLQNMDEKTQHELRNYFPERVQPNYENGNGSIYSSHKHFLSVKNGFLSTEVLQDMLVFKGTKDLRLLEKKVLDDRWSLDLFFDIGFPKKKNVKKALREHTTNSGIIKTKNVETFLDEMKNFVDGLYRYSNKVKCFVDWQDLSTKKVKEFSLSTINNYLFDKMVGERQDSQQVVLGTLISKGDVLN